jgi:hypothetical protein
MSSWTLRDKQVGYSNGSTGTTVASAAITVGAGDLVTAWVAWYMPGGGYDGTSVISAGNTLDVKKAVVNLDTAAGCFFYKISAAAETAAFTATINGAVYYRKIIIMSFTPTGGSVSLDAGPSGGTGTAGTAFSTGAINITAGSLAVVGFNDQTASTLVTPTIGGTAADGYAQTNEACGFYLLNCGGGSSVGAGNWQYSDGNDYVCDILSFKIGGGGGGAAVQRPSSYYMRRRIS